MGILVHLAAVVLFGALAGWIAAGIMHLKTGFWGNALIGIIGSITGSIVLMFLGGIGTTGFNVYSLLVSVGGACLFTWVVRRIDGNTRNAQ